MFSCTKRCLTAGVIILASTTAAHAQLANAWASFQNTTSTNLDPTVTGISTSTDQVEFARGDLDKNGWIDLVVVRKQPFTTAGKRTSFLLMNYAGVLTDKTAQFATASDVVGDLGFQTPTNTRDAQLADFDKDGWLDVVTAATISDGDPKHIGHPRIYRNLGNDLNGNWLGLKFEAGRSPQMFNAGGNPQNPRFAGVAAGDLTGDGYPDLYFSDHDSSGAGGSQEPAANDLNDRLWINGGAASPGFFTDQSIGSGRMTSAMLLSAYGTVARIADFNQDGANDVMKNSTLNPPQNTSIIYNHPANQGFFNQHHIFHTNSATHIDVGDLNKDGRLDVAFSDDNSDGYRFNTGNSTDGLNRAVWSSYINYTYATSSGSSTSGDGGFSSNNVIADLDNDHWPEVLQPDLDLDINDSSDGSTTNSTTGDYLKVFHNRGGTPGAFNIELRHERQATSTTSGWKGVFGPLQGDLKNSYDVAPFDVDNDGDIDLVIGNMQGMWVWQNLLNPTVCQMDIGFKSPGSSASLKVCGGDLMLGHDAFMTLSSAHALQPAFLFVSLSSSPVFVPPINQTLATFPVLFMFATATTGNGGIVIPVPGASTPVSFDLYAQYVISLANGSYETSNAVKLTYPVN